MLIGTQLKRLLSLAVVALPLASLHGQTRWTIEQQPVLEIESESQGESTLFTNIVHVEQLRTGELLVVDGATREGCVPQAVEIGSGDPVGAPGYAA